VSPHIGYGEALALLRTAASQYGATTPDPTDPVALGACLRHVAQRHGSARASAVAEAVLDDELQHLVWDPMGGVAFVGAALAVVDPAATLLDRVMIYLSLYFQELDSIVAQCREDETGGVAPAAIASTLQTAIDGLDQRPGGDPGV
jgi:hypothetical protein